MIKVLLVDDDLDLLDMVCLMLVSHNMDAECISDGGSVLPILQNKRPDVLVMDIFLGNHDGRSLCRQVKDRDEYSTLPVLLYSAGNVTRESIKASGANDFISKPFDMTDIIRRITELARQSA
jgi:DNA-binding response OmpR family regulator